MKTGMRSGSVAPRVGRFKKAKAKATKTDYIADKLAKLRKVKPAQRPEVQGATYRPLKVETNAKVTSTKPEIKEYITHLNTSEEDKRLAAKHKPQPKPHAEVYALKTVIKTATKPEWSAEQKKAWRKANKASATRTIYFN